MEIDRSGSSPLLGLSQRLPPCNIQAEQALLGALLANNRAYERVSSFLEAHHFADPIHCRIYQAIVRRVENGKLADAVTLKTEFEHTGVLDEVGGVNYLAQLLTAMVGIINVGEYGHVIVDCWARRQLIDIGEMMVNNAFGADATLDGATQVMRMEDEIAALASVLPTTGMTAVRRGPILYADAIAEAIEEADGMTRGVIARPYSTGIPVVDEVLGGGIEPDTLIYMVGAGKAGKTQLALQIAEHVAIKARERWVNGGQQGPCPGVLYIMLGNMKAKALGRRGVVRLSGVPLRALRHGNLDIEHGPRLKDALEYSQSIPLEIFDTGASTIGRVLGDMRRTASKRPLVLTVVDNFTDMLSIAPDKMFATAVSTTKILKEQGASAMHTSVLLLMHLNSSIESGSRNRSPRPRSGDIPWGTKKDADVAFGIHRPLVYLEKEPPARPAKRMSQEGESAYAELKKEWQEKFEPWPVGLKNITEVVPMALREEDGEPPMIGRLLFDQARQTFYDVAVEEAQRRADLAMDDPV